jgi:hypothetical protein
MSWATGVLRRFKKNNYLQQMKKRMKLRASSLPALSKCGVWKSKPFDTALTLIGNDRHDAFEAALKLNDRTKLEALPATEAEGVEWAIDYVKANASDSWPMEFEDSGIIHFDDVKLTGRWDLVNGPHGFDLKNQLPADGKSYAPQLALYAMMIMVRDDLPSFTYHVLYAAPKIAKVIEFTREGCERIVGEVIANVHKAEATPCSYCSWCDRASTCPALNETAITVGKEYSNELSLYNPKELDNPANLARALKLSRALKPWAEDIERRAKKAAVSGIRLEGFKLQQRSLPTQVGDLNEAFNLAGLPAEDFMGCCKLTLGKLYDAFASANDVTKTEAKREVQARLATVFLPQRHIQCLTKAKDLSRNSAKGHDSPSSRKESIQ